MSIVVKVFNLADLKDNSEPMPEEFVRKSGAQDIRWRDDGLRARHIKSGHFHCSFPSSCPYLSIHVCRLSLSIFHVASAFR